MRNHQIITGGDKRGDPIGNYESRLIKFTKACLSSIKSARIPCYSNKYSKKTYTQHQLIVINMLMKYMKTNYRDIVDWIDGHKITKILKLKLIPHFTTLHKFFQRFSTRLFEKILVQSIKQFDIFDARVAIDSSGYSSYHVSKYFVWRIKGKTKRKFFMKDSIVVDSDRQIILSHYSRIAPSHDNIEFKPLIRKTRKRVDIVLVTADKGYDDESNHKLVHSMNSACIIPVREWKNSRTRAGYYRRKMAKNFNKKLYAERNKSETVFFVIKRKFGEELSSRSTLLKKREIKMKNVVYNLYRKVKLDNSFLILIFTRNFEKLFKIY